MKKQIHLSSRSEDRPGNARSIICHRGGAGPVLLLAVCCAVLTGLAWPARAAVTEAWVQRYNGPANDDDRANAVAVDGSGNVVVTGYSSGTNGCPDFYTAKYAAADGALLWDKRYNGPANGWDKALAVAVDASGNVVVTGWSGSGGYYYQHGYEVPLSDYYTAKYAAANGALLWEKRYNGPADHDDRANAVAVDSSGNVVVTGYSNSTNVIDGSYYADYYTAKYAAADGALLWEKRYSGPVNRLYEDSGPQGVVVDGSGNVVVTGSSHNGTNADYYTAKYAAVDGTLLWEKHYNGPGNGYDYANAVAVDGSGNVVVTGTSYGTNSNMDYYTAKYAAADGALLWEKRYNGPENGNDVAQAVAVDGSGNVVVTGSGDDYCTAKYAAADGALLWEQRYNGPSNSYDRATAVAVDGSGNVVVTRYSGEDYYTAKYAAADGVLLWEKRYNGPVNGVDLASSLAIGPNGMVVVTGASDGNFLAYTTYDYATVVYRENLPPVSIARVSTGIRLRLTGVPGHSYNIQRAPAVTGPWTTLATPTAPLGGLIEYVDTNPPVGTAFYRTSAP